jgi:peroxiredoxin
VRDFVHFYPEVKVGYTRLVTISTDNLLKTNEFRDGEGAQWPFLSDPERVVQRDLDIQEYTDPTNNPMIPYTLVLEPGLKIYKIYNGYWFWGRPSISDLWSDLREVTHRIRPDWDITTPEMRAAWERGEKDRFYPYGKKFSEVWADE